jgi:hypothetical protein
MFDDNKTDRFDVATGARKLAIDTVLRALVDHASATDPSLRRRIIGTVDAYVLKLAPKSELELDFAERAKSQVCRLIRPSDS